jgi:hypothetical protein
MTWPPRSPIGPSPVLATADQRGIDLQPLLSSSCPGAAACRRTRIAGCLHMTIQSAVLIETLMQLGASAR